MNRFVLTAPCRPTCENSIIAFLYSVKTAGEILSSNRPFVNSLPQSSMTSIESMIDSFEDQMAGCYGASQLDT